MLNSNIFLTTKKLVESYALLQDYFKKCREKGVDCTDLIPTANLLSEIQRLVESRSLSFIDLLGYIRSRVGASIKCDVLIEAFKQQYGVEASCEEASKALLMQLTAWYVEMLESLGYVKVRMAWKP